LIDNLHEWHEALKEDLLPSRSASAAFRLSRYRSTRWAKDLASFYEQVIKPAPAKGEGAEVVAIEDVTSISTGFCLETLIVEHNGTLLVQDEIVAVFSFQAFSGHLLSR
jgi:hypothetical protein